MHQLVKSMDTQLLSSLQASIKMVKEAHNTWSFIGVNVCDVLFHRLTSIIKPKLQVPYAGF